MSFLCRKKKYKNYQEINDDEESFPIYKKNNLLVSDLDSFFIEVYEYYCLGGYKCIKTKIILDNITYLFSIHFLMILIFFFDWKTLIDLKFQGENKTYINFDLTNLFSKIYYNKHKILVLVSYFLFVLYYVLYAYNSFSFLDRMRKMSLIFHHNFNLHTQDLESISFNDIMNLLIRLQEEENYCRVKDHITKYDIITRICRKDNYITALLSNNIINLNIFGINFFTDYTYHCFKNILMDMIFRKNDVNQINPSFFNLKLVRLKIFLTTIFQIITMPVELIFKIVFWIFFNANKFQGSGVDSQDISSSSWEYYLLFKFKNYNELKHHFRKRISKSYGDTNNFLLSFKQKFISIISKSIVLILGGFIFFGFLISYFIDVKITQISFFGFNFVFMLFVIGFLYNFFKNIFIGETSGTADLIENYDIKANHFKLLTNHLQNIPTNWDRSKIHKNYESVYSVFKSNIILFVYEIISIIVQPFLWWRISLKVDNIISFIKTFSTKIDGIGTVCTFSVLNLSAYKQIKLITSDLVTLQKERDFMDIKFINSLLYFEKNFDNEKYITDKGESDNDDNNSEEEHNTSYSKPENSKLIDSLINFINNNINKGKILTDFEKHEFEKNIYFYINNYKGITITDIFNIIKNEKISFVDDKVYINP